MIALLSHVRVLPGIAIDLGLVARAVPVVLTETACSAFSLNLSDARLADMIATADRNV